MRSKLIAGYLVIVVCLLASAVQACTHTISASIDTPAEDAYYAVGDTVDFTLEKDEGEEEGEASCSEGCTITYSWAFGDGAENKTDDTTSSPSCEYNSTGEKTVTLTATCPGEDSADSADDGSGTATVTIYVTEVDKIEYEEPADTWTDVTGTTLYVAQGDQDDTITLRAVGDPDVTWDDEEPTWTNASGTTLGEATYSINSLCESTVEAVFGTSPLKSVVIVTVGVASLKTTIGETTYESTTSETKTVYVAKGDTDDTITLEAIAGPDGATWPDGEPSWATTTGLTPSTTNPEKADFSIEDASTSISGTTIEVTCGESKVEIVIVVYEVILKSIGFTSDHGLMKNNGFDLPDPDDEDWTDSGSVFSEPEWEESGTNNPISQTRDTSLVVDANCIINPSGLNFDLSGDGAEDYMDFTSTGNTSTGSEQAISITADDDAKLPDKVTTIDETIDWTITLTDPDTDIDISHGDTGSHEIFVTYADPVVEASDDDVIGGMTAGGETPTYQRMKWACKEAVDETIEEGIVDKMQAAIQDAANFDSEEQFRLLYKYELKDYWEMLEDSEDPYWNSGDCYDWAILIKTISNILGVSPESGIINASKDDGNA